MPPITLILGPKIRCDPGHGHPKRPVSLVEAREIGPESVGRLSILCNHSLSRSKLLKQLRFLFFQRIPDAPKLQRIFGSRFLAGSKGRGLRPSAPGPADRHLDATY